MGHRMELYVSPGDAQAVIDIAGSFELEAQIIGRCEVAPARGLTVRSEFGEFRY